jgi:anti-sigma regulatory factor (Ser/Thr protein kinase)
MTAASSISNLRGCEDVVPTEDGIARARARAVEVFEGAGWDGVELFSLELCLHEALVNALVHGVRKCGASQIRLSYEIESRCVRMVVDDNGAGGELQKGSRDDLQAGHGRGLWLMRAFSSRMRSLGSRVTIELDRDADPISNSNHISTKLDRGLGVVR